LWAEANAQLSGFVIEEEWEFFDLVLNEESRFDVLTVEVTVMLHIENWR